MAKLVFDIETSALPPETFDDAQQEYLFREATKLEDEAARETKRAEIRQQFNLWPFTAQVVCVAMLNADSQRGQEYRQPGDGCPEYPARGHRPRRAVSLQAL